MSRRSVPVVDLVGLPGGFDPIKDRLDNRFLLVRLRRVVLVAVGVLVVIKH